MAILLSRGGNNILAEVQRWQYFLLTNGFPQVGSVDADFGGNTEKATKFFQVQVGVPTTGALDAVTHAAAVGMGYRDLNTSDYTTHAGVNWPPPPAFSSPGNAARNSAFQCFKFKSLPIASRPDKESIVIEGSCDGTVPQWVDSNIVEFQVPQLDQARGYNKRFRCHRLVEPKVKELFAAWEAAGLLHLLLTFDGAFVPRYVRDTVVPAAGHPSKKSSTVTSLSNHAFGSAFDINASLNPRVKSPPPPEVTAKGSVRFLVPIANSIGFFWGGHYQSPTKFDGMHFEFADFSKLP